MIYGERCSRTALFVGQNGEAEKLKRIPFMVDKLLDEKFIDYEKYIRNIDPSIPRSFLNSIIKSIEVTDGMVTAISFSNGIVNRFEYK